MPRDISLLKVHCERFIREGLPRIGSGIWDIYARKFGKAGGSLAGVILGEHYFFRVENDAALLITLEEVSGAETRLEIIACAAGHGLLGFSYGAHDSYVHTVEDFLTKSGLAVKVEQETSYFDRNTPLG